MSYYTLKQVPPFTRWVLTIAIAVGLTALVGWSIVLDEETEFGPRIDHLFSVLFAINLGPVLLLAGLAALLMSSRPHSRKMVPVALAFVAFGAFFTWLFFFETYELPDIWPN